MALHFKIHELQEAIKFQRRGHEAGCLDESIRLHEIIIDLQAQNAKVSIFFLYEF